MAGQSLRVPETDHFISNAAASPSSFFARCREMEDGKDAKALFSLDQRLAKQSLEFLSPMMNIL